MIIRGGGAIGAAGLAGAALCICVTLLFAGGCATGGALRIGAAGVGVATRGGTAIAGGAAPTPVADEPEGGVAALGGVTGVFGGITTTDGGRYVAATEAGVTILGAGGAGASLADLGGIAFGATGGAGASAFASTTSGLAAGRATGCSAAPFCCVIARSTSPGREILERSILVLMPSSSRAARAGLAELGEASERPRRCFRTRSASWSSRELEWVFFSVTPTAVSESRISLLLTSNSRARSLIRILLIRSRSSSCLANVVSLSAHIEPHEPIVISSPANGVRASGSD
jgi:hypothetical protein